MKHLSFSFEGNNRWWKYLVLFLASLFGGQTIGGIPLFAIMFYKIFASNGAINPSPENMADLSVFGISANLGLFLMVLPFLFCLLILLLLFKPFHRRNYITMITGSAKIRWKRFFIGAGTWLFLCSIYLLIDYLSSPGNFVFNFDFQSFIVLLLISVTLIPIQSSYEEIMFRGYLAQGVAAWTKNRWMVILLPSLLFGSLHIFNPEISEYGFWITMPQYILFGIGFGLITVLDDGTELAMGAHSANNVFLSIVITTKASVLQTPALMVQQTVNPLKDLVMLIILFGLFITILKYFYKWDFRILNKRIESDIVEISDNKYVTNHQNNP